MKSIKKLFLFLVFLLCIVSLNTLNNSIKLPVKNDGSRIYLNPNFKHLTFGMRKFFSSLLWINTLLDSDVTHYKHNDLKSWMYLRFNAMTELDPFFLEAYRFGSLYLSVIKDDIKAASALFSKGLKFFPKDYNLNLYGAYHALYEENDKLLAMRRLSLIRNKLQKSPLVLAILYSLKAQSFDNKEKILTLLDTISQDTALPDNIKENLIKKIKNSLKKEKGD